MFLTLFSLSLALSSFVQPTKEEKVEEGTEKNSEEAKVTKEGEGAEEEQKKEKQQQKEEQKQEELAEGEQEVGESQNIFHSPLRLVRKAKMKLVVCHVTLLDGTDFSCEVEV